MRVKKTSQKKKLAGLTAATLVALGVGMGTGASSAVAVSDHNEYYYGGGRYLQANAWMGAGQKFGWSTSSKYLGSGSGPSSADSITNTVKIWVNGIGVSLGNASGSTTSDKDFGASWTNYKRAGVRNWISDLSGTNSVSNNFYLNINETSSAKASIPYFGTPRFTSITITKWA